MTDTFTGKNGTVCAVKSIGKELAADGWEVYYLTPESFPRFDCMLDWVNSVASMVQLCRPHLWRVTQELTRLKPTHVHLATEWPLGVAARIVCRRMRWRFSSAFHTLWPEFLASHKVPRWPIWRILQWFHRRSTSVFVPTDSMRDILQQKRFKPPVVVCQYGVDTSVFAPSETPPPESGPIQLVITARVVPEKNIAYALSLDTSEIERGLAEDPRWRGRPVRWTVIGDGKQRQELERQFPDVRFRGELEHEEIAQLYPSMHLHVFPSLGDTFGQTATEALACGLPVAAHDIQGPRDILSGYPRAGAVDRNLTTAIIRALKTSSPSECTRLVREKEFCWRTAAKTFERNIHPIDWSEG